MTATAGAAPADKTNLTEGVGDCVTQGDAGAMVAACDAPLVAPSGGICWSPDAGAPDGG
jgi:hypothetical protein